jgi:hypothetical protein
VAFLWCLQPGSLQHKIPISKKYSYYKWQISAMGPINMTEKSGDFVLKLEFSGELNITNKSRSSENSSSERRSASRERFTMEEYGDHNKVVFA